MMVVVVRAAVSGRYHDDAGRIFAILAVVVVVVVVVMVMMLDIELCQLDVILR